AAAVRRPRTAVTQRSSDEWRARRRAAPEALLGGGPMARARPLAQPGQTATERVARRVSATGGRPRPGSSAARKRQPLDAEHDQRSPQDPLPALGGAIARWHGWIRARQRWHRARRNVGLRRIEWLGVGRARHFRLGQEERGG